MRPLTSFLTLGICLLVASPLQAAIQATAAITEQTGSVQSYHYNLTLNNTGTTNITTFWYAWDDSDLNFLPSLPVQIIGPANWIGFYTTSSSSPGHYGIEWYNYTNTPLTPGHSLTGFSFESNDAPSILTSISDVPPVTQGDPAFPIQTSFVYMNYPAEQAGDPGYQLLVSGPVPEPASAGLLAIGIVGLFFKRRGPCR